MSGPIRPDEVGPAKIPQKVFEVFNDFIERNWNGHSATFRQDEVVARLVREMEGVTKERIFRERWLDVEDAFRAKGWIVVYDKPGHNESYSATFTFSKPSK